MTSDVLDDMQVGSTMEVAVGAGTTGALSLIHI